MKINLSNHTTSVSTVIKNIETVLKKNRNMLTVEEVQMLEESIKELKRLKKTNDFSMFLILARIISILFKFFSNKIDF